MSSKSRYRPGAKKAAKPVFRLRAPRRISRFVHKVGGPVFANDVDLAEHLQKMHYRGMQKVALRTAFRLSKGRLKRLLRRKK